MKKSKSPAEQITAARAVSPRKALALTAAVLAAAITATGCSGTGRTETEPESQAEITAGPAVNQPESPSSPMEAKPSKARQPMWMIFMMR